MTAPTTLLLISSKCPHCASVLQGLSELVKAGDIARLDVVNISLQPELAQEYGVRSVPWMRIGPFELEGLHSVAELRRWAEQAGSKQGMADYFHDMLKTGGLEKVRKVLSQDGTHFSALLTLQQDPQTELPVRIGISAMVEEYEGSEMLQGQIDALAKLTRHPDARIRLDACHFLSLTHSDSALAYIKSLLQDDNAEVREVAKESLETINERD